MISNDEQGKVITFYSFKGGTGRTMALANVACLLAQKEDEEKDKGKDILIIDWDLEAPGLHKFFVNKLKKHFNNLINYKKDLEEHPGLLDIFIDLGKKLRNRKYENAEKAIERLFRRFNFDKFIIKTDIPKLYLLKSGRYNSTYSKIVNTFKWEELFKIVPSIFRLFAIFLSMRYKYVLIDSRTGFTDISGICTMLMPEILVVLFTPNNQSLTGLDDIIQRTINYRKQSDDLRPIIIFPVPSRIEMSEKDLRKAWRYGNRELGIPGYQILFEELFKDIYNLSSCDLNKYFNEVQIQHSSRYSYGEDIASITEDNDDRLSIKQSYKMLTERITNPSAPWEEMARIPIINFIKVTSPTEHGWIPVKGLTEKDIFKVVMDKQLNRRVLYSDTRRFRRKYDWVIDYPISYFLDFERVIMRLKPIRGQRFAIYFRVTDKKGKKLDYWVIYQYKGVVDEDHLISKDNTVQYDPKWINEIVYSLEYLYPKHNWDNWIEIERNLAEDFSRDINGKKPFGAVEFNLVTGIRIRGPCYLDFIEFKERNIVRGTKVRKRGRGSDL